MFGLEILLAGGGGGGVGAGVTFGLTYLICPLLGVLLGCFGPHELREMASPCASITFVCFMIYCSDMYALPVKYT